MKPGYKRTEVGVMPEEWELTPFVSLGSVIDGDRGTNYPGSKDFASDGHCLFLNAGNVTKAGFRFDECSFISSDKDAQLSKGKLKRDDIVLTTRGTVGNFAHFNSAVPFEHIRINSGMVILRNGSASLDTAFLYALLQSHFAEKQIERLTFGSAQPQLTVKGISKFAIVVPPLLEQRAIATALNDVAELQSRLDQIIFKKRDLKQAAMQQLLTGKIRLPGFHDEWEIKRLGDVFTIFAGKSKSAYVIADGDYWVCDMGAVSTEGRLIVSKRTNYRGDFLRRGDLIMPKDDIGGGNIIGKVGYIEANDTYILGDHVYCLRAVEGDPRFLAYVINAHRVNTELRKKVIGSAQLGLGRKSVFEQEIQFPKTPEQSAIAEVLTDMDSELAALEQRREKTSALKQAMMQELLTGKTRLVSLKEAHA